MFAFISHKFLTTAVILLLLLSVVCQIIIGVLYQSMIHETENMSATENKLLKQCKTKFSNCYQLNAGVSNIPIFVDKFLNRIRLMGISITSFHHFSGQLMLLSVFAAGLGICKGIIEGQSLGELLPYYIISLFGLYIYFSVSALVDAKGKKRVLKTNIVDYLENSMVNRLNFNLTDEVASKEWKPIREPKEFVPVVNLKKEKAEAQERTDKSDTKEIFRKKEADELEQLLEKLLV